MKKTGLFGLAVLMLFVFTVTSCQKKTELSKMIPSNRVTINGKNSNLFEIKEDSVKVMLVKVGVDGDKWEVRTNLPLKNTTPWNEIPGSDPNLDNFIYGIDIYAKYVDKNDSELDLDVETDYQSGETLLKSNEIVTGNVPIVEYSYGNKSYEKQKAYFDHIDGAVLTVELSWAHKASSSNTSSTPSVSSSNSDLDKLLDEYEKYVNECVNLINRQDRGENISESQIDKLLGKIEELEKKLDDKINKMSDAQYERYEKLDDKIWDAI